jgi:ParB family transcriptional regulator, chromosome partitioning protein
MTKPSDVNQVDVPIAKLMPVRARKVKPKAYARLLANIKAVGLIEPLCVYKEGEQYLILDGYVRHKALMELAVETVPCILLPTKDIYTPNRQVNNISAKQETKLFRKALEKVDEKTLAQAFALDSVKARLDTSLCKALHPTAADALEAGKITRAVARELTNVQPKRQAEIVKMMQETRDWTLPFAKTQILKTPPNMRSQKIARRTPWGKSSDAKRALVKKLAEVERHFDFYSGLYRQYVGDLLKLTIYVRQILGKAQLRDHLRAKHAETLRLFESIVEDNEGKAVSGG